jgi:thiamine phosphate synthase YjbQ (UPF0047 family)
MEQAIRAITVTTPGRGLTDITGQVRAFVAEQGTRTGLLTIFCRHTSASLLGSRPIKSVYVHRIV